MIQKTIEFIKEKIKILFSKKRYYLSLIIILLIVLPMIFRDKTKGIVTSFAEIKTLNQTILATGQVTSVTDLSLSFSGSGIIKNIKVSVGDKVKKGQILANLEQGNDFGQLNQARGQLLSAEAKYKKVLEGATNEEIAIVKTALDNAKIDLEKTKKTQEVLVENAKRTLFSSSLVATPSVSNGDDLPTISGTYTGGEGIYTLSVFSTGAGGYFNLSGIESGGGSINTTPTKLGTKGLFVEFPSSFSASSNTSFTIEIPNTKSTNYITNLNAYNSALQNERSALASAEALVNTREAEYNLKIAKARDADLLLAQADVLSAKGNYENALANFEKTIIRAPADGTITKVVNKIGELATSSKEVIVLQDIDNLYIKTNINESNITSLKIGQNVSVTFDAFPGLYTGSVVSIDPSAKIEDGIVNYEIKISLNEVNLLIRPGMNADIKIDAGSKENVLVIPKASVRKDENGEYVDFVKNTKNKKSDKRYIQTGLTGDGAMIEVISGISNGDEIIVSRSS